MRTSKRWMRKERGTGILGVIIVYLVFASSAIFVVFFMNERRLAVKNLEASRLYIKHRALGTDGPPEGIGAYKIEESTSGDYQMLDIITDRPDDRVRSRRRVEDYPADAFEAPSCAEEGELDWNSSLWQRKSCRQDYKQHTKIYFRFFGFNPSE